MKLVSVASVFALTLVVGLGSFFAGRKSAPPCAETDPSSAPQAKRAGERARATPRAASGGSCEARLADAVAEIQTLNDAIEELETEIYGTPIAWSDATPEVFRPAKFEEIMRRALEECDVDLSLVRFECGEPPCYLIARRPELTHSSEDDWWRRLQGCAVWKEAYPSGSVSMSTDAIDCPDGTEEGFLLLSPTPEWLLEDEASQDNYFKRFQARSATAKERWVCGG